MKESIIISKDASPDFVARKIGLPEGRYGAFKSLNGFYLAETKVFFGRMRELGLTPIEKLVLIGCRTINNVPSGKYTIRKTPRAYCLERVA